MTSAVAFGRAQLIVVGGQSQITKRVIEKLANYDVLVVGLPALSPPRLRVVDAMLDAVSHADSRAAHQDELRKLRRRAGGY